MTDGRSSVQRWHLLLRHVVNLNHVEDGLKKDPLNPKPYKP